MSEKHAIGYPVETQLIVSPESIRQALERILASAPFLNARRASQFLSFVVESTLAGNEQRVKEYLVGVEVFARPADYDPKDDPIVRIEAGRLRKKLAEYYKGPGANDPVIIELPKGGYVPVFRHRPSRLQLVKPGAADQTELAATQNEDHRRQRTPALFIAALLLFVSLALASFYYFRHRARASAAPTSIAVLPFLDLGADSKGEYISDGVTEELTTGLAELKGLRVVAASSAYQFRGKSEDVRKIGQALNAEALLEGSITRSGSGVRIDAQLVNTRNGYNLWSKAYNVPGTDLLDSEDDIVQETARVLRVPVSNTPPLKRDTENPEAHDLYLHGRYLWSKRDTRDIQESARLFERAIKDDPNYALAYAGLADAYTVMAVNRQLPPATAVPQARQALQRALQLDPNLAEAHATLGLLESQCDWDWHGAEHEFRRAIELQPNYAEAHHWAGLNYMAMGQFAAAEAELRQAQVLDPLSFMITEGLAENFYFSHRYDEAITTALSVPDHTISWVVTAHSYIFKGMYKKSMSIVPDVVPSTDAVRLSLRAEALALSGDHAGALAILQELERNQQISSPNYGVISPADLAMSYAVIGEKERAFVWLEKAYEQHDPLLAQLKVDPSADSLRSDPRFQDMLKKLGLNN